MIQSRKETFTASLLKFVQENGVGAVLYLTGVDLTNRSDAQMKYASLLLKPIPFLTTCPRSPIYALTAPGSPALGSSPISLISQLPTYKFEDSETSIGATGIPASQPPSRSLDIPFIPGGGLTRRLLALSLGFGSSTQAPTAIPAAAILQFVLEGDNRADAEFFASVIARILKLQVENWKQPPSWKVGLFGTPHDQTLYG